MEQTLNLVIYMMPSSPQETKSYSVKKDQPFNVVVMSSDNLEITAGSNSLEGRDLGLQYSETFMVSIDYWTNYFLEWSGSIPWVRLWGLRLRTVECMY